MNQLNSNNMYTAKELNIHCKHLTLVGMEEGRLGWMGTPQEWDKVAKETGENNLRELMKEDDR